MRQTSWKKALLAGFLALSVQANAEAILKGKYWENPPTQLYQKPFFLAHVFNPDAQVMAGGSYQIGIEIQGKKRRSFILKPNTTIPGGQIKSFPIKVAAQADELTGTYRFFYRVGDQTSYSPSYSFRGDAQGSEAHPMVTPLYTEALPEPEIEAAANLLGTRDHVQPPPEVPFESDRSARPAAQPKPAKKTPVVGPAPKAALTKASPTSVSASPAVPAGKAVGPGKIVATGKTPEAAKAKIPTVAQQKAPPPVAESEPVVAETKPRTIDSSEFKTLRTIDEELVIYVMKKGDTLKSVAEKYYGDSAKVRMIADINFIDNQAAVKVGEEIIVDVLPLKGKKSFSAPNPRTAAPAGKTEGVVSRSADGKSQNYVIQHGDTLSIIAKKFYGSASGASLILEANPGLKAKNLRVGKMICIPNESDGKA